MSGWEAGDMVLAARPACLETEAAPGLNFLR
jgi:hypothetical protein